MGEEGAGRCARLFPNSYTAMAEAADATKAVVKDVLNEQSMLEVKDESDEDTSREEPHASDMLQAAFDARVREHPSNTMPNEYVCKEQSELHLQADRHYLALCPAESPSRCSPLDSLPFRLVVIIAMAIAGFCVPWRGLDKRERLALD